MPTDWDKMDGPQRARSLEAERRERLRGPSPLGWCFFCLNHPRQPMKVAAVTKTKDGTPRCAPCGTTGPDKTAQQERLAPTPSTQEDSDGS